jgi:uncharacterized protein YkwD
MSAASARFSHIASSRFGLIAFVAMILTLLATAQGAMARGGKARIDRAEHKLLGAINAARARHGVPRLALSHRLAYSADFHCWDMLRRNYFGHGAMARRVKRFDTARRHAETLAYLPKGRTPAEAAREVIEMWLRSPGHRQVLLSRKYRRVGVGRRAGNLGSRPVADAGNPSGSLVVYTADFASAR